jgi:hypothetical protein
MEDVSLSQMNCSFGQGIYTEGHHNDLNDLHDPLRIFKFGVLHQLFLLLFHAGASWQHWTFQKIPEIYLWQIVLCL